MNLVYINTYKTISLLLKLILFKILICLFIKIDGNLLAHQQHIGFTQVYQNNNKKSQQDSNSEKLYDKSHKTYDNENENYNYNDDRVRIQIIPDENAVDDNSSSEQSDSFDQYQSKPYHETDTDNLSTLNYSDNIFVPEKFFKDYIIWLVERRINKAFSIIIKKDSFKETSQRRSIELGFKIKDLEIPSYKLRAHRLKKGNIIVNGNIPINLIYNTKDYKTYYKHHSHYIKISESNKILLLSDIAKKIKSIIDEKNSFSKNDKIILQSIEPCIDINNKKLFKSSCINFSYGSLYYRAKIDKRGIQKIISSSLSFCGVLKNVHTINLESKTQDFSVKICDNAAKQNKLANEYFVFKGQEDICSGPNKNISTNLYVNSTQDPANANNNYTNSDSDYNHNLDTEDNSNTKVTTPNDTDTPEDKNTPPEQSAVYTYNDEKSTKSKMIHVYSYINRMYDWYLSLGFLSHPKTPISLEVDVSKVSGNAQISWIPGGATKIVFGTDGGSLRNLSFDFDIIGHELGHFIVNQSIIGQNIDEDDTSLNYRHCKPSDSASCIENHTRSIHEALSDFFVMAATNDECIAEGACQNNDSKACVEGCLRRAGGFKEDEPIIYDPELDDKLDYQGYKYLGFKKTRNNNFVHTTITSNNAIAADIHAIGQMISGVLWDARKNLKDSQEKRKFDKVILNALDLSPSRQVSYNDLLTAIIYSDEEINQKKFCQIIIDSAKKYNIDLEQNNGINLEQFCDNNRDIAKYISEKDYDLSGSNVDNTFLDDYSIFDSYARNCVLTKRDQASMLNIGILQNGKYTIVNYNDIDQKSYINKSNKKSTGCKNMEVAFSQVAIGFENKNFTPISKTSLYYNPNLFSTNIKAKSNKNAVDILIDQAINLILLLIILLIPFIFCHIRFLINKKTDS